jgi:N-acetylmuramic acid 6-phosphate etherase
VHTEHRSPRYEEADAWPAADLVDAIVEGQLAAVAAVRAAAPVLARAIEAAVPRLVRGGRLVYCGAGTSGRIAAQDAVELAPTFDWPEDRIALLMAGGPDAFIRAAEGAEDDEAAARSAVEQAAVGADDVVLALAASGRTPYTIAALAHARHRGALGIGIANNPGSALLAAAEIAILLDTGAEVVAGSTRMKAGTAQKAALNAISTGVMIRLGRVYRGYMVDMRTTNRKLGERAHRMVAALSGAGDAEVRAALEQAGGRIKVACLLLHGAGSAVAAERLLEAAGGRLREAMAAL